MMVEPELDFEGADATHAMVKNQLQGSIDADIADALADPWTPDALLARPFDVIARYEDLRGPEGPVDVPEQWGIGLPARIAADDAEGLVLLYQRVLREGSRNEQASVIHGGRLLTEWSRVREGLPEAVVTVWQHRFPQLARDVT